MKHDSPARAAGFPLRKRSTYSTRPVGLVTRSTPSAAWACARKAAPN